MRKPRHAPGSHGHLDPWTSAWRGTAQQRFPWRRRLKRMTRLAPSLVALLVLLLAAGAFAQSPSTSADALRVTWQPRPYSVVPSIEGEVQNDSPFWVSAVRLQVEGFDASGEPVGQTSTWTFGNIAPGGRGHFVLPPLPRAATYRISVSAFDRVSRGAPPGIESP
jgi:hypothetical protein